MSVDDMYDKALDLAIKRERLKQEQLKTQVLQQTAGVRREAEREESVPDELHKHYRVTARRSEQITTELRAASPGQAAELVAKSVPGWHVTDVESRTEHHEVVGLCEACGIGILDDEEYGTDPDGDVMVCGGCSEGGDE